MVKLLSGGGSNSSAVDSQANLQSDRAALCLTAEEEAQRRNKGYDQSKQSGKLKLKPEGCRNRRRETASSGHQRILEAVWS